MKDSEGLIIFILGVLAAGGLFWGVVTAIRKSFAIAPQEKIIDSSGLLSEQRRHTQDIKDRQKRLIEDQKQRIRDLQRR